MKIFGLLVLLVLVWLPAFGIGGVAAYLSVNGNPAAPAWEIGLGFYVAFVVLPITLCVGQSISDIPEEK